MAAKAKIKIGTKMYVWWRTGLVDEDNRNVGTVLEILPYTGRYTEFFDCVLKFDAHNTSRGWLEIAFSSSDVRDIVPEKTKLRTVQCHV